MTLSAWLAREGLTALAFARRVDRSHTTIGRLLRGETRPDWKTVERIHGATGGEVTANDFLHSEAA